MTTSWLRGRQCWRLFYLLVSIFLMVLSTMHLQAQTPATTQINDIVYRADGTPAGGTLLISWPAFTSADQKPVAAGSMSVSIGDAGRVNLNLIPNQGATPAGTFYKVVLKLDDGTTMTEYWTVPSMSPATISAIRSSIVPASVAAQMVSRQYLDSNLVSKADNAVVLHNSGDESVAGIKTFAASPMVPTPMISMAAANKAYVDTAVSNVSSGAYVNKNGDTMSGPLSLAGDPVTSSQAATRHYVDTQTATVNTGLAQKLGRIGDTPISLAGLRFASQFSSIQDAITDAGSTGSVLIPADYAGIDNFTNPQNIPIVDLRGGSSGPRGYLNVKDFGARGDAITDDWAAIQAAIDAASAGTGGTDSVYVPKGIYRVLKPLHISRGIKFYGAGENSTTITSGYTNQGPLFVISPPVSLGYTGVPTGPALASGNGSSMYLDGSNNYLLNFRDVSAVELNGRNSLTVELFYKPNARFGSADGTHNILSSSGWTTPVDSNTSLVIQHGANDQIIAMLNVSGTLKAVGTAANAVQAGTTYHIAFTYDGTMLRLFLNGALQGSTTATGAIKQLACEDFLLGPTPGGWLESSFNNPMTNGWVDSIRISSTARYTADFTAPSTKATFDSNTMLLLNFDNNFDQFTTATTPDGAAYLFLRRPGGSYGQVNFLDFRDLNLIGTGPYAIYTVNSRFDNVMTTGYWRGFQLINNDYLNRLTSVKVIGAEKTLFDLGIGPMGGVLTMSDIALTGGHYSFYQDTGSAIIDGLWIEQGNGTEIGAVFKGWANSSLVLNHPVFSAETNPSTNRHAIAFVNMGNVVVNGGVIETSNGAPHIAVHGGTSIIHNGGNYSLVGTAPTTIFRIYTPPTNKVQLVSPMQQWMSVPWSDNMSAMAVLAGADPAASKGVPNGYASLDSNALVPNAQINWAAPGTLGSTSPVAGTFTDLKCQTLAGAKCADAYPGADWGAKVSAAIADLPAGGGLVDARALTGSQSLSSDLVIAKKSVTILAGQTTLAMGASRIVVQPGANQFAFLGYSAGWGPDQSFTAGGTALQYTGNGSAFKIGGSGTGTNFIRLENFQIDVSGGGSAARAMEIDNTIGGTLSNLKLLGSITPGTAQEALRFDATGGMNAYMLLHNLYLGGGHNTLHLTGASGQGNSAFQIIGGTARTNNTTDGTGVLLEYASNVNFMGFDVESALVGYSFGSGAMQNILSESRTEGNTTDYSFVSGAAYNKIQTVTLPVVTDADGRNSVMSTQVWMFKRTGNLNVYDQTDSPLIWNWYSGATADQNIQWIFNDKSSSPKWTIYPKTSINDFAIAHAGFTPYRLALSNSGSTQLNSEATQTLDFNVTSGTSTGGVRFGNGAGSTVATVTSSGKGTFNGGVQIGTNGTALTKMAKYTATISPSAVAANTCATQSFTVTGVATGDMFVAVQKPTEQTGLNVDHGHVTASNTLTINFCNHTASSITPTASETYTFLVAQ
ncbi:MAG TPA: glycosyl hydrolase family 28-related protein [Terriglobales bacterium]|nr:glycosyl hydrolase family 28-related protein [Terriglobales bacterium]